MEFWIPAWAGMRGPTILARASKKNVSGQRLMSGKGKKGWVPGYLSTLNPEDSIF